MRTIAVCDDDEMERAQIMELVRAYLAARPGFPARAAAFSGGAALLEHAAEQGGFDLYLLDILMPETDGIAVGRRLRELGCGGEIIFLTASNEFAAESYEVGAFSYLLKPVRRDRLFAALDRFAAALERRGSEGILVAAHGGSRHLLLADILYVERVGRIMRYYCAGETVDSLTIRVPFREMAAPLLADRRFYLCGASFVLNLQHVAGVDGRSALLDSGRRVLLPRTAAAAFKEAWGKYWLEEG